MKQWLKNGVNKFMNLDKQQINILKSVSQNNACRLLVRAVNSETDIEKLGETVNKLSKILYKKLKDDINDELRQEEILRKKIDNEEIENAGTFADHLEEIKRD